MNLTASPRALLARRDWPIAREPAAMIVYAVAIDVLALAWTVRLVVADGVPGRGLGLCTLLAGLAIVFEEISRRIGRLKFRISADLKRDMTSVWSVAAIIALPPVYAVICNVVLFVFLWFRQERPAGEILYRKLCSHCTGLLGVLTAGLVLNHYDPVFAALPWQLRGLVEAGVAIAAYTAVNRGLITGAIIILGVRKPSALLGTVDDNLIEAATLCLGALVAAAARAEPVLCMLVIPALFVMQRGALVRELETAASTDSKTGLLNAVAWEQVAQRELARAQREGQSLAVLIIDIDRFKTVNDRYGHLAGDVVLKAVGKTLTESIREYDTVGRFGGEEFVAVLPDADPAKAMLVAERVRLRVTEVRAGTLDGDDGHHISVSVGVACLSLHGHELPELLHAADRALYRAKAGGRNQVVVADLGTGGPALEALSA